MEAKIMRDYSPWKFDYEDIDPDNCSTKHYQLTSSINIHISFSVKKYSKADAFSVDQAADSMPTTGVFPP